MSRRLLVVAALLVATLPGLAGPGTAAPTGSGGDGSPATLRLVDQTPFVGPTGLFSITFTADNPPPGAQIVFRQYADVASSGRDRFTETIRGQGLGRLDRTIRLPLQQLPRDPEGHLVAAFPISSDQVPPLGGLQLTSSGVFPLTMTLETADGDDIVDLVTYIVKLPPDDGASSAVLTAAVVLPLTSAPGVQPSGATQLQPDEIQRLDGTLGALAANPGAAVTMAATPETMQALVSIGDDQVGSATAPRQVPETTELTASPYVEVDLGAWIDATLTADLTRLLFTGAQTLTAAVGRGPDVGTWIVDPTTTPATLDWLVETGVTRLAVPEQRLAPLTTTGRFGALAPFDVLTPSGGRLRAIAGDDALTAHLADTDDPVLNAHTTFADLAMLYFQEPGIDRATALILPHTGVPPTYLDALLASLAPAAFDEATARSAGGAAPRQILRVETVRDTVEQVAPVTGDLDLVSETDTTLVRTLSSGEAGSLGTYPTQLGFARASLDGYRSMLGAAEAERIRPLEQLVDVSAARPLDDRGRQDYLDATVAQVDETAADITLPAQPRVTLTEEAAEIPVVVDNGADFPMEVKLVFTSDKLDFPDGTTQQVTLAPGSNRLPIAVDSRTTGAFPITLTVSSPDGTIAIASTRFTVRSTAVSGIGLVISIGAGLFLLLWWVRNFRSARRRRSLIAPET